MDAVNPNEERGLRIARRQGDVLLEAFALAVEAVAARRPLDQSLSRFFAGRRELGKRDRRLIGDALYAYFRWRGWLDGLDAPTALSLAWRLDRLEPHPALTAFEPGDADARVSALRQQPVEQLAPSWLADELMIPKGVDARSHVRRFIESIQSRPPTWLRLRRGHPETVTRWFAEKKLFAHVDARMPSAIAVPPRFHAGSLRNDLGSEVDVQDIASQAVAEIAAPRPGERWWDACAGSGGKSLHLADLMQQRGSVLATDVRSAALDELKQRARAAAVTMISPRLISDNGENEFPGSPFDGVLVDAPCSGIGTWSRNADARWRCDASWVKDCAARQLAILNTAAAHVSHGGRLVYATCSVTRRETTDVIDAFLQSHSNFTPASAKTRLIPESAPDGRIFLWPWDGPGDGMFIAALKRL